MRNAIGLLGWLAVVFVAAMTGSQFMPGEWYASLQKPAFNPPNWIFAPVWTLLYILMGVAAWMVWKERGFSQARVALALFIVQLVLNAAWSWLFFGLHRMDLGMVDIIALAVAIACTVVAFWRIVPAAGALLLPYLAWVLFASFLNFTLWRLNIAGH